MPIYEFYCPGCDTVYNFFSRQVNTAKIPKCPGCKTKKLKRRPSLVATLKKRDGADQALGADLDPDRMERAMNMLAAEVRGIDEDDPRQAANLMRKLSQATGLKLGPAMEEALGRLSKGEDPEEIEGEMGDLLSDEQALFDLAQTRLKGRSRRPRVDETLYDL